MSVCAVRVAAYVVGLVVYMLLVMYTEFYKFVYTLTRGVFLVLQKCAFIHYDSRDF